MSKKKLLEARDYNIIALVEKNLQRNLTSIRGKVLKKQLKEPEDAEQPAKF